MPSILIGTDPASGAVSLFGSGLASASGRQFPISSGRNPQWPLAGVRVRHDPLANSGGIMFIGLSGGMSFNSGSLMLSGGSLSGLLDGYPLLPGESVFIPRAVAAPLSGLFDVFAMNNAQASGQRLYWEADIMIY